MLRREEVKSIIYIPYVRHSNLTTKFSKDLKENRIKSGYNNNVITVLIKNDQTNWRKGIYHVLIAENKLANRKHQRHYSYHPLFKPMMMKQLWRCLLMLPAIAGYWSILGNK